MICVVFEKVKEREGVLEKKRHNFSVYEKYRNYFLFFGKMRIIQKNLNILMYGGKCGN